MIVSPRRIVDAADAVIPAQPEVHPMHAKLRMHREMLMVGIVWEMAHIKPSYPEMSHLIGCAHTTAMQHLQHWRELPWQDRYGWLRLVEGRLTRETNTLDAVVL